MKIEMIGLTVVAVLFLVVILGFVIRAIMQRQYEKALITYQNKILSQEMEEVRSIYMTMRGWRHDYHNHMQSVKAYLAKDNIAEAKSYIDRLEEDLADIRLLFDTGNLNIDAILNAKISLALENGIRCDYKAVIPKELSVSDIDLCVVIGNLIDNAVESCRTVKKESSLSVYTLRR